MTDKKDLKIIFFGTPEFAVESLDTLYSQGYNIAAVVTMPDKPAGRGHRMFHSAVKEYALRKGIPLFQPVRLKDEEFVSGLRRINADLFIVIAFRMLPEVVWSMPRLGTFNLHASLLPKYRGAAPINWAVMNGEKETGVTTFFLKHEIDTGDIIRQERITIGADENVGSVHDRLMHLGARLTADTVAHILAGDLKPVAQDELLNGAEAIPAPKIFKETCRIDWNRSASGLHNFVRGLSPYPCAWTELRTSGSGGELLATLKIGETRIYNQHPREGAMPPGTVSCMRQGKLIVSCGDGSELEIMRLQPSGKKMMDTAEFCRGFRIPAGEDGKDMALKME